MDGGRYDSPYIFKLFVITEDCNYASAMSAELMLESLTVITREHGLKRWVV